MPATDCKHTKSIARNAGIISVATLLSRILGFLRDLILAAVLGAGPIADAFFVAFRLPNILRRLFAEGSLTMAFVPVYTRYFKEHGSETADSIARGVQIWLLILLLPLCLAAIIFSSKITAFIAPGFTSSADIFGLTSKLIAICFPYIIFISAVALCMGILNSRGHFLAPALAPCILNLTLISAAGIAWFFNINIALALAWGVLAAGSGQWILQQPFLKKKKFYWTGRTELGHPGVKRIGKLMLPTILGAAAYQLNILIGTMLASMLSFGSISYLYYADRLVQFPLGVFGVAISTAALPSLSTLVTQDNIQEFKATLSTSITLTLFISIPATAGLIGLGNPLLSVLFEHGQFDSFAVTATDLALFGYAIGLPAFSSVRSLISSFYALEDTRTPVIISIVCMLLNIAAGYMLMQYLQHLGLAIAVSLASWTNVFLLAVFLKRRIGPWGEVFKKSLKTTYLSLLLLGISLAAAYTFKPWVCLALIPVLILGYMWLALKLKIPEAELIVSSLSKKLLSK